MHMQQREDTRHGVLVAMPGQQHGDVTGDRRTGIIMAWQQRKELGIERMIIELLQRKHGGDLRRYRLPSNLNME